MAYPFFWVERDLIRSPAFLDLSFSASRALLYFFARCQYEKHKTSRREEWIITNNGDIIFTYQEAEELGFAPGTFRNCLVELQDHGFIHQTVKGHGAKGRDHRPSRFGITTDWRQWTHGT